MFMCLLSTILQKFSAFICRRPENHSSSFFSFFSFRFFFGECGCAKKKNKAISIDERKCMCTLYKAFQHKTHRKTIIITFSHRIRFAQPNINMYPYKECNVVAVRPTNSNSHYKHTSFNSISLIEYKTCESKNDKNELKPPRTERFGESDKERNKPRKNANKKVL